MFCFFYPLADSFVCLFSHHALDNNLPYHIFKTYKNNQFE